MHDSSQLGSKVWKCEGETLTNFSMFPLSPSSLASYQQALTRHTMTEGPIYLGTDKFIVLKSRQ